MDDHRGAVSDCEEPFLNEAESSTIFAFAFFVDCHVC